MMRSGALPINEMIASDPLVLPVGTCVWWLMSRGWAGLVHGGMVTKKTKNRQEWGFLLVLAAAYLIMFGITVYGYLS